MTVFTVLVSSVPPFPLLPGGGEDDTLPFFSISRNSPPDHAPRHRLSGPRTMLMRQRPNGGLQKIEIDAGAGKALRSPPADHVVAAPPKDARPAPQVRRTCARLGVRRREARCGASTLIASGHPGPSPLCDLREIGVHPVEPPFPVLAIARASRRRLLHIILQGRAVHGRVWADLALARSGLPNFEHLEMGRDRRLGQVEPARPGPTPWSRPSPSRARIARRVGSASAESVCESVSACLYLTYRLINVSC